MLPHSQAIFQEKASDLKHEYINGRVMLKSIDFEGTMKMLYEDVVFKEG